MEVWCHLLKVKISIVKKKGLILVAPEKVQNRSNEWYKTDSATLGCIRQKKKDTAIKTSQFACCQA